MKANLCFTMIVLFISTINSFSQLRLTNSGDIGIGTSTPGAKLEVRKNDANVEAKIYSYGSVTNDAKLWTMNNLGAYGFGISGSNGYIWSNAASPQKLIAFDGSGKVAINYSSVHPTYKFYVNGNAAGQSTWYNLSDFRLKKNVRNLENCLPILLKINGKQYNYLNEELNYRSKENMESKSFGFIAQEVKEILPELVMISDDSLNTHFLNYDGFIPIIVEAIKEQHQIINELQNEIEDLKILSNLQVSNLNTNIKLMQNIPNPFTESTKIEFSIDDKVKNARICIYDLTGKELKCYNIKPNSDSFITIKGKELKPGIYIYSLIVDNQIFDTKKMVLTQ